MDKTMNKTDLINLVTSETEEKKATVEAIINATFNAMSQALKNGEKVLVMGFGTFEVKEIGARNGRNPRTGEDIVVESYKKPAFTASKVLKEEVNK